MDRYFIPSILVLTLVFASPAAGQDAAKESELGRLRAEIDALGTQLQSLAKAVDDVLWFQRVGDVAEIDKVTYVGPPNPRGREIYGIKNERHPFRIYAYVFVPRKLDRTSKHALLILPHGGVHANFGTYHTHIIREMMDLGYVVLAPECRGSTGYGQDFYEAIDYGGLEVDDVVAGRDWAVENLPFVDDKRVGIVGWSHGGLIALMAVFDHPEKFQVAYAGVPVSDLVARMGYQTESYRGLFSASYHIGKTANEDVDEYRRRSPRWNAHKLRTPLLIHTTTNDRDVNVLEVESLIQALKASGKDFQYKIYQDAPGGHGFNRIDTALAKESRREIYEFLARYLRP
ncbi:MAG TPA: prolyl oligopeptidase family serine peptidase [Acidobacteriota bacterium]|nr:prolyl oligopeptidase family serine peptidase [Acidobacteriota bacterium]